MGTRHLFWFFLVLPTGTLAQTNVLGEAPVTLEVRTANCTVSARTVDVFIDIDGLVGMGGPAGINGFVLVFNLDQGALFQNAGLGTDPFLNWTFTATDAAMVTVTNSLTLVGVVADTMAPNQKYHVASLELDGPETSVTLSFNQAASSLSSRVVNGDGPGPILMSPPDPITLNLVSLSLLEGVSHWRQMASDYDLAPPSGPVDILDLVALSNCSTGAR